MRVARPSGRSSFPSVGEPIGEPDVQTLDCGMAVDTSSGRSCQQKRRLGDWLDTPPSKAQLMEIIDSVCGLGANGGQFGGQSPSRSRRCIVAIAKVPAASALASVAA